jgi:hypothetical protein
MLLDIDHCSEPYPSVVVEGKGVVEKRYVEEEEKKRHERREENDEEHEADPGHEGKHEDSVRIRPRRE